MHNSVVSLVAIKEELQLNIIDKAKKIKIPAIIAVSKTFDMSKILPLINFGHFHFGENKVKEAVDKWTDVKLNFKNLKLHMIGKLQTNKVKHVISLFDYLHSLDNLKLAEKISKEQIKQNKRIKIFIQVNIGGEEQKSGIRKESVFDFYKSCRSLNLDIIGAMCIPPKNMHPDKYFLEMNKLNKKLNLSDLSMGMSEDYLEAALNNATYLRIGAKIFGARN